MNVPLGVLMERLRQSHGGRCTVCGSTQRLEFAHTTETKVNGKSRGGRQRYYDIRKNPECYRLLCRVCHLAFDLNSGEEIPF